MSGLRELNIVIEPFDPFVKIMHLTVLDLDPGLEIEGSCKITIHLKLCFSGPFGPLDPAGSRLPWFLHCWVLISCSSVSLKGNLTCALVLTVMDSLKQVCEALRLHMSSWYHLALANTGRSVAGVTVCVCYSVWACTTIHFYTSFCSFLLR